MEHHHEHGHETHEASHGHTKISGEDILKFLKMIFREGFSKNVIFATEQGKEALRINVILLALIFFIVPLSALLVLVMLIVTDYSISLEQR